MFQGKTKNSKLRTWIICVGMAALMVATAYASNSLVQDRRVSLAQAQEMAFKVKQDSTFPVGVNELVVAQLNKYLGTPEGRDFMRSSLARMETYRSTVEKKLREYHMPSELIAVPLIESGYQNLSAERNPSSNAAGIWQFIASTARSFNMIVDKEKDQRLDVAMETDAAMRYLLMNKLRFNDWQLSAMAFNMGERSLQAAIDKTGSRDAWTVIRAGHENDKNYLPKLMAAILIMKNPSSLN